MARDIGLKLDVATSEFNIVNKPVMPEELQAAIVILFFSKDNKARGTFDGIYNLIGTFNNNTLDAIELELTSISFSLTESLRETYPNVNSTNFEVSIDNSTLTITLTIVTNTNIITDTIYSIEV